MTRLVKVIPSARLLVPILLVGFFSPLLPAQEINLTDKLTALLYRNGRIYMGDSFTGSKNWCSPDGFASGDGVPGAGGYKCLIKFKNLKASQIPGSVTRSGIEYSPLDEEVKGSPYTRNNCGPDPYDIDETLTVKFTEGKKITRSVTITEGNTVTLQAKEGFELLGIGFDFSQNEKLSFLKSETNSENLDRTKETTITEHIVIKDGVKPMTLRYINLVETLKKGYVTFKGDILIQDADLTYIVVGGSSLPIELPFGTLARFVPEESARTLRLSGQLSNFSAVNHTRTDIVKPLTSTSPECQMSR